MPAERAGVLAGDIITHVNGIFVRRTDIKDFLQLLNEGGPGTVMKLAIRRGDQNLQIDVTKSMSVEVKERNVTSQALETAAGKVGVIRFDLFYSGSYKDVYQHLEKLMNQNGIKGLVLDLRNNPGGQVTEAAQLLRLFIEKGPLFILNQGREQFSGYSAQANGRKFNLPMVILVNEGSASASELVSSTLQDYGRAIVVGTSQTFGKGSAYQVMPLQNDIGAVNMTVGLYFTASGKTPQSTGTVSDIVISKIPEGARLEKNMPQVLPSQTVASMLPVEYPLMPNRAEIIKKLSENSTRRMNQTSADIDVNAKAKDSTLNEAAAILSDLIQIKNSGQ